MKHFEIVCIFKPNIGKDILDKNINTLTEKIENLGGKVVGNEDWGLIDFAYTIKKLKKGFYQFLQVDINGEKIKEISNFFNIEENIIRNLIINVDKHEKLPTIIAKDKNNNEK